MALGTPDNEVDLEAYATKKFELGHRLNQLNAIRAKLEAHEALAPDEQAIVDAANERYEADPFADLFSTVDTCFNLLSSGQMSSSEAHDRIIKAAKIQKRLAELKGISSQG